MTHVAVLRGGKGDEFSLSLRNGIAALDILRSDPSYKVKDIVMSKTGEWLVDGFAKSPLQCLQDVDVALIASHGSYGEGGLLQRELIRHNVPHTGSSPFASAMTLNKVYTKKLIKAAGQTALPQSVQISHDSDYARAIQNIGNWFGPEYIVKPIDGGSSIGIVRASGMQELLSVIGKILESYSRVIVEEFVHGAEVSVSAVRNFRGQKLYVFPAVEIVPTSSQTFFSSEAKELNLADMMAPARLSASQKQRIDELVRHAYTVLDIGPYARFDLVATRNDVFLLEVNTQPQFHENTPFQHALESVGVSKPEFIQKLLENARSTNYI